ncbi:MAG: N-acetylmuramoyl-L-alanine amidase [Eubacteriales bacterium]|nr:N-acetylmuramoyl-L-alanine amidase [Eubacteriales bacterium]
MFLCLSLAAVSFAGTGCGADTGEETPEEETDLSNFLDTIEDSAGDEQTAQEGRTGSTAADASSGGASGEQAAQDAREGDTGADASFSGISGEQAARETDGQDKGIVVIDPGHQRYANTEQEPIGPGSSQTKYKVSGGTVGAATGIPEYELALRISLKLRDELEKRGYRVVMVRESNDVDLSNSERAAVANEADADVFIRIHANGSGDSSRTGAMTICQTPGNVFNGDLYTQSRALADCVLNAYTKKTGIDYEYVWETDTMSGINWCRVPTTILEMGYMSNIQEDYRMQDPEMQALMVEGIADGIDAYMEQTQTEKMR